MSSMATRRLAVLSVMVFFVTGCGFWARVCQSQLTTEAFATQDTGSVTGGDAGRAVGGDTGSMTGGDAGGAPGDVATFVAGDASGSGAKVIIRRGSRSPRKGRVDTLNLKGRQVRLTIR